MTNIVRLVRPPRREAKVTVCLKGLYIVINRYKAIYITDRPSNDG